MITLTGKGLSSREQCGEVHAAWCCPAGWAVVRHIFAVSLDDMTREVELDLHI